MKFLTVLTICLVFSCCAQADFLESLKSGLSSVGNALKTTFSGVLDQGKQLGTQLLTQAASQGKDLLGQAAQSLLLNVMNSLQSPATAKRDLSSLMHTVEEVKQTYGSGLHSLSALFNAALGKLQDVATHLEPLSVDEVKSQVNSVVSNHKNLLDGVVSKVAHSVAQKLTSAVAHLNSKRQTDDLYHKVQSGVQDFLKSHADLLQHVVEHTGHSLTDTVEKMQGTVNQHLQHLSQSLSGHLHNLGQNGHDLYHHGSHALDALKQMLATSMQKQPATNDLVPEQ